MIIQRQEKGQAIIEYALLVAIAILALVTVSNFVSRLKRGAFENHFDRAAQPYYLSGGTTP